jgi:hypothetical protein
MVGGRAESAYPEGDSTLVVDLTKCVKNHGANYKYLDQAYRSNLSLT